MNRVLKLAILMLVASCGGGNYSAPRQLDDAETHAAIDKAISDLGAESIRDMGRVMAELRTHYAGQMDFGAVGPVIKERLMK